MTVLFMIGTGLICLSVFMTLTWFVSRIIDNAGVVDISWALGFSLAAGLYAAIAHITTDRQIAIILMYTLSSLRLAIHLFARFRRTLPQEDRRYTELRKQLGDGDQEKLLLIFLWQGAVLTLMTAPLAVSLADDKTRLSVVGMIAIFAWLVSFIGEAVADRQLQLWISSPNNAGRTCQWGLWRYSRHPNYFFEWLASVSFACFALQSPHGTWTLVCPLVFYHILINVTGVRPSEDLSIKSRPDYRDYQQTTSAFFPMPRRTVQ